MSDVESALATLPVALVYGDADACVHLRTALAEFHADIVYDSVGSELDPAALGDSGARVAVVNLDDTLDAILDDVYAALESCGCAVVFNDPGSSAALEGWEHARWVRHLAAKLRDDANVDPPRPADAESVNVAEAAHLSDQWLDDALGVLATDDSAPAAAAAPEPNSGIDLGAVQIPGNDIDADAVPELDLELTEAVSSAPVAADAPSETPAAAAGPAADPTGDFDLDLDLDFDLELDLEAPAPSRSPVASAVDSAPARDAPAPATEIADADDPEWNELEQQLNASFASDTDPSVEAPTPTVASDALVLHGDHDVEDVPTAPAQRVDEPELAGADLSADGLSIDWSLLDDDNETSAGAETETVAEGLDAVLARTQPTVEDEPVDADIHVGDISAGIVDAGAATPPDSELPPSSQWQLVDDTLEPPPNQYAPDAAESAGTTRVPGQTMAESLADRDFGIELVDPIEYLAPDAPPAVRETELYAAPEMMSMAEALAPQQIDENIHAEAVAEPLPRVVVMAASIGGPDAVREFLAGLPANFPAIFILTQHMGTEFIDLMVKQLGRFSGLPVRVPTSGERASAGDVLVVPNGAALSMSRKGALELTSVPGADDQEPAIAATMGMAAKVFGADTVAIIFSGMVADAVAGTGKVIEHGGVVWAQDSASCVVSTMVDRVTEAGMVKFSATPAKLAEHLIEQFAKESAP